ncbi:MAG: hypothetical protein U5K75_09820 [Ahrensia sp.]|nr:hypothetical protein [Ahrensia sp.]
MKYKAVPFLLAALILGGCTSTLPPDDPRQAELIASECGLYFAAESQLIAAGRTEGRNMSEGCPESARAAVVDISAIEPPHQFTSSYAETLYRRMIARGMPKDIALQVSKSAAFKNVVDLRDTIYAS